MPSAPRSHSLTHDLPSSFDATADVPSVPAEALAELPESDVTAVLQAIVLEARALTQADYAALGLGSRAETTFEPWVFVGVSRETAERIGRHPKPVGLLGAVVRSGEVIRCKDLRSDPRFQGMPRHHPEMASFLGVPIRQRGRSVGHLYLANKPGDREFSETDERLIRTLAGSAGVAIETAALYVAEKRQRAWLRNVIDQLPHGVLLYDEQGRLQAMNQACAAFCHEPSCTDRYGNPVMLDLRTVDGRPLTADELPMTSAFETEDVILHRELVLQTCGRPIPVLISALPVRAATGQLTGVTMIVEDISERKQLERMREEWSAIVAHDLRQPVGVIKLAADLLLHMHAGWSERERKILDRIQSSSTHLSRMIGDLMDASLIESRRLSIDRKPTDVGALVQSVVESLDAAAAGYEVRVKVEGPREAFIDADRIRQVLGNLLSNATKYGRPGTEILIEMFGRDDVIEIVVTNHGPGIPAWQVPLIFSRFERAREARVGGLGLGLYIAKGLVEAHGGRIWVESIPDKTTTFHVELPRSTPTGLPESTTVH
jgi:signal transduction histidine kinase